MVAEGQQPRECNWDRLFLILMCTLMCTFAVVLVHSRWFNSRSSRIASIYTITMLVCAPREGLVPLAMQGALDMRALQVLPFGGHACFGRSEDSQLTQNSIDAG